MRAKHVPELGTKSSPLGFPVAGIIQTKRLNKGASRTNTALASPSVWQPASSVRQSTHADSAIFLALAVGPDGPVRGSFARFVSRHPRPDMGDGRGCGPGRRRVAGRPVCDRLFERLADLAVGGRAVPPSSAGAVA